MSAPQRIGWGTACLLVLGLLAVLAFTFELGRYQGHREGIGYAERRAWIVAEALEALQEAQRATRACHDLARYLKTAPDNKKATGRRLNVAKRALEEPCRNCGGE